MSSAKWQPFCLGFIVLTQFSNYILHFQWNQVKCHKASFMIRCTDGSFPVAPRHQTITWTKFCQIQHIIHIIRPKIHILVTNALEIDNLALSQCRNAGNFEMISASLRSVNTRDLTGLSLWQARTTLWSRVHCATHMKLKRVSGASSVARNLHDLLPTSLRELSRNNEVYCDIHKLRKLWNIIYDVSLSQHFKHPVKMGSFKLVVSYFGTPGLRYHIRTCDVLQHF